MGRYQPKFKPQLTGTPLGPDNCNMAAAAVFADYQTLGAIDETADQMRAFSGDTVGGTNITDAATALAHVGLHLNIVRNGAISVLNDALLTLGAIVHGDYDQVPNALKGDVAFEGLHSIFACYRGLNDTLVYDSLDDGRAASVPKGPILWPNSVLDAYASKFPGGITYGLTTLWRVHVIVGAANIRPTPSTAMDPIDTLPRNAIVPYGKIVIGQSVAGDARWFRVWDSRKNRLGYMHASVVHTL